jgi:hypothetical protein
MSTEPAHVPRLQEDQLQNARPVLLRALVREFGVVHEVVMRLEVGAFGTSQVSGQTCQPLVCWLAM